MAHTKEQRDRHALCGARKKNGEKCRKFAGEGTNHRGVGRCPYHLGNTKSDEIHAVKEEAERRAVEFGQPFGRSGSAVGSLHYADMRESRACGPPSNLHAKGD